VSLLAEVAKDLLRQIVPLRQQRLLIRYALSNSSAVTLDQLHAKGFKPGGAIDVGAYHGEWTRTFSRVFQGVPILMIEAQADKRDHLERTARRIGNCVDLETALLSREQGAEVQFFMMETGSSIYPENTTAPRHRIRMHTETLDTVVSRHPRLREPYFIKLDVQGAELDVLRGGAETLGKAEGVMLEASVLNYNEGAPGLREIIEFMEAEGFAIYDIANLMRLVTGDLCQLDAIFLRHDSAFRPTGMLPLR
jgi:FkbM family methyltransferase